MNTNIIVTNLRASAFLPQIAFGKEIIDSKNSRIMEKMRSDKMSECVRWHGN